MENEKQPSSQQKENSSTPNLESTGTIPLIKPPVAPVTPPVEEAKLESKKEQTTPLTHSYSEDLAQAMQATDAETVQELLTMAREKESIVAEAEEEKKTNWLFVLGAILCFAVAGAAGWFVWNRYQQTQPVVLQRSYQQVLFPQLPSVVAESTDIRQIVQMLKTSAPLQLDTPTIVPLIAEADRAPLTPLNFFAFIEGTPPHGLTQTTSAIRLGGIATGQNVEPFILITGTNQDALVQELRAAELELGRVFYRALGIDIAVAPEVLTTAFTTEYVSNVPVRIVRRSSQDSPDILYGFISDDSAIITTSISAFQLLYNAAIAAR